MIRDLGRNLRQALRALRRTPGFTALAVVTLGLAIGVNVGIFGVIDTVLLDPLPFRDSDELVVIAGSAPGSDLPEEFPLALEFFVQYDEESEGIASLSTFNSFTNTLRVGDRAERLPMSAPTYTLFETLGVTPQLGRLPTADDEDVMLLSHGLWMSWFGGDPAVVGRSFHAAGALRTVIGVMGPDFWFPFDDTQLWVPWVPEPAEIEPGRFGQPLVARLAPGATPERLATELGTLARHLPERFGGTAAYARIIEQLRPVIRPLEEALLGDVAGPLWILLGAMLIVLLIACANVANLFMVRAERRQAELAVRRALGAGRRRLIVAQLAEAAWVAAAAGVLAVVVARLGFPVLVAAAPAAVPRLEAAHVGVEALVFAFAASALSALLCGLVPAVRFSAPSFARLREGGRGGSRRRPWGRNVLVAAQTALALVLLIGSALLVRSLGALRDVDPGYDTADLFTFQFAPEEAFLTDAPSFARFHLDFMGRLAALPGVQSVGLVENVPLDEGVSSERFRTATMSAEAGEGTLLSYTWSAGDYFRTMGIEVFRGRVFGDADHTTQLGNVLVSRAAADLLWPGQDPLGKRLQMDGSDTWETVVGVVDDVLQYDFRQAAEPMVYFPLVGQDPETSRPISSPAYVVKTPRADEIAPEIRALVKEVTPSAPMYRTYTMSGLAADSMARLEFTMLTLGLAAALALVLGVVGLYGVLSYAVAERTREIGVRMALGANRRRVRWMVVRQGARVVATGVAIGGLAALLASRALQGLLFGVESFDLGIYTAVSALMLSIGLLACYLPARRASAVDPMVSLRAD